MGFEDGSDEGSARGLENAEVFHAVFLRYSRPILAFLFHLVDDRSQAEELTQETFMRAYRARERMLPGARMSTWLFGIARNVAHEAIRDKYRSRRETVLEDVQAHELPDEKMNPAETYMSEELRRAIQRSLASLTEDQRLVFVLKLLHKMRYEQISMITGSSVGKLKTDLHRARQQMRQRLQGYFAGGMPGL